MRQLLNPTFAVRHLDGGMRLLVFKAATGEEIGVEVDDVTAAKWASQIVAPKSQD
jgi:hypothetical protein